MNTCEILGIGNPIIDHVLHVDDKFMDTIPGQRGGMVPVDYKTFEEILLKAAEFNFFPISVAGGSCSNTLKGLAHLGYRSGLIGMIGKDAWARKYVSAIQELGITPLFQVSDLPTAQVLCLVTPNGERTCRTFLGASQNIQPEIINPAIFNGVKLVHVEGYSLLQSNLTETVMQYAKEAKAKISFDLASFEVVKQHKERILYLLAEFVDIVFGNEKETFSLVEAHAEKGCKKLIELVDIAIVMQGNQGCWVGQGNFLIHEPVEKVKVVDTTGAGDLFASGFLAEYMAHKSLRECARVGNLLGSAVVQVSGSELPRTTWNKILRNYHQKDEIT